MRMSFLQKMQRISAVFLASFALNFVWENLHAPLYMSYREAPITESVLFHAAIIDALILTALFIPLLYSKALRRRPWIPALVAIIISILMEHYALHTGRWTYSAAMPVVPVINTGLTPTIQLGLIGWFVYAYTIKNLSPNAPANRQSIP